jgi:hypothetical protein
VNENVLDPPAKFTVMLIEICVPQTNEDDVLIENGTVFDVVAPSLAFGYGEFGCVMVTPAVGLEIVAETLDPIRHPSFLIATLRSLHSFRSIFPFPFPPDIVADWNKYFAEPLRHWLRVTVPPSVTTAVSGPAGLQT